jgi:hypothetical protein
LIYPLIRCPVRGLIYHLIRCPIRGLICHPMMMGPNPIRHSPPGATPRLAKKPTVAPAATQQLPAVLWQA